MKEKIKDFLRFVGRTWSSGWHGRIGLFCMLFAGFGFLRLFFGDVTIQGFIGNIWKLGAEEKQLATEKEKLDRINHHIKLIQEYSPDYVEEVSLKHLNMGDPKTRILKD